MFLYFQITKNTFCFSVFQTPTMIQRLILALSGSGYLGCGQFYFYLEHIADYMALLNSSINFAIYILFSPHFRHTLKTQLCTYRKLNFKRKKFADVEFKIVNNQDNIDNALEPASRHVSDKNMQLRNAQIMTDGNELMMEDHRQVNCDTHLLSPLTSDGRGGYDRHHHFLCASNVTSHESLTMVSHDEVACGDHLSSETYNNDPMTRVTHDNTCPPNESHRSRSTSTPKKEDDIYLDLQMDIPAKVLERPSSVNDESRM